jgi:hypothetical protein
VEIYQNQSPDGVMDPPLQKPESERRLDGFRWHPGLRPVRGYEAEEVPMEPELAKVSQSYLK